MGAVWDEIRQEGFEIGYRRGLEMGMGQSKMQTQLRFTRSVMETLHLSAEEALAALGIPEEDRAEYLAQL